MSCQLGNLTSISVEILVIFQKTVPLSGGVGPSGASLPGDFSPDKNTVEKGKHAGAGAPKGSPC